METPQNLSIDEGIPVESWSHKAYPSPSVDRMASSHKPLLTPATVASSSSISSSPLSSTSYSATQSLRFPLPSPRRSRIDHRYAAKLAPELQPRTTYPSTSMNNNEYMPPPTIQRSTGVFRPIPIVTANDELAYDSRTPRYLGSTSSLSDHGISDRFIPNRATSNFNFNLWEDSPTAMAKTPTANTEAEEPAEETATAPTTTTVAGSHSQQQTLLNTLLRSELLGENDHPQTYPSPPPSRPNANPLCEGTTNHFRFQSSRHAYQENVFDGPVSVVNAFSLTPTRSAASLRLMASPPKRKRRISKVPFKVLDAPALQDDFYLNLVDWSSQNVLAVALGSCVYLWSACTSKVTKLCDLSAQEDVVTSVSWAQRGQYLAVGTNRGETLLWDTTACRQVRTMEGHSARVGALAWSGPILASGSRDRIIYLRDVRVNAPFTDKLHNHKQEVCGLKWSYDEPSFLASGGNDNNLHVIDSRNPNAPIHKFTEHTAAVKAITWSPHQHGLLASGGGTADRCIRFWNTLSGTHLQKVDTGSQVCNLAWSQNCNEIVSTHGYSLNQIVVWRYPTMTKVTTLTGHTFRVLYLAVSPDGSTVVTGAGDETLRFWQIFPGPRSDHKDNTGSLLFPNTIGSVIR